MKTCSGIVEAVYSHLGSLSFEDKITLINNVTTLPISIKDGKFFKRGEEIPEVEAKDTVEIISRWLRMSEIDKLYKIIYEQN